ncbi:hypothetical protein B0A50_05004 [Salinomyces thailandicus]|uniref:Uncharacterized protein n=1 Tax=Salinomyces thailandicus TaxID=706561 RepID=A0A4U0TZ63_9PEZI|nr:hypothetical protein B0A50_05004 [Salinomyces thailandica]
MARVSIIIALASALLSPVEAKCYDPSPAFPVPDWKDGAELKPALDLITDRLEAIVGGEKYDKTSFSVEITSNTETLWTHYHSARIHNATRLGVKHVDGDSQYRIASITKTFTTLGIMYQHAAGNLSLDDPLSRYIPELAEKQAGTIPWHDITLRSMASQLSGIPREMAQGDLINRIDEPWKLGLPPVSKEGLPDCYEYKGHKPCTRAQLLNDLKRRSPVYAPNQQSTYSNVNLVLLGLVLENVTGMSYSEYIDQAIFKPLNMASTSLETPPDDHAVLPLGQYYWDIDEGVYRPTGGIYSSSSDLSKFLRYILTHYNAIVKGLNWIMPASWSMGMHNFYGMPFEIFRTDRILEESRRPVTFVTKAGGEPDYFSRISMLPEYGLGITTLVTSEYGVLQELQEIVSVTLVRAAESAVWSALASSYAGSYAATDQSLNTSMHLSVSAGKVLEMTSFISNGTDVLSTLLPEFSYADQEPMALWHAQLQPTLLYKDFSHQRGEIWRLMTVSDRVGNQDERPIFDDLCLTDVDFGSYGGLPINEMVFWQEEGVVELSAWRMNMTRAANSAAEETIEAMHGDLR